ncbi:hypothetical protein [Nocardiopsis dassonvillei]|uniref:hypothetical protein n=1 Tax=Nocardiopsis dassonvillei TaxID=2014 RepID=UPI00366F29EF
MTLAARAILFFSSYSPLFALLAIRFEGGGVDLFVISLSPIRILLASLALAGLAGLAFLFIIDKRNNPSPFKIESVSPAGSEAASYLAAYLLPFMTSSTPSWTDLISYFLFLCIAALIHFHSSIVQINPLLYLMGYRVLRIRDNKGLNAYMVTRREITEGEVVMASKFGNDMLIERHN